MWTSADLAGVLFACWCLDDHERREELLREHARLRMAFLVNYAFCDGKKLEAAAREFADALATSPHASHDVASVVDAVHEHLAAVAAARG